MADILSLETPYQDQDTVTSTNLNDLVKKATFTSAVVDGATTQLSSGAIIVRDGGVTEQKLSTATQAKLLQGPEIAISASNSEAFEGGTKSGNARGTFAIDIQNKQSSADPTIVASGDSAAAFGFENKASGNYSSAVGSSNAARGLGSSAVGNNNDAREDGSTAVGYGNSVDGSVAAPASYSSAFGYANSVTDEKSIAAGYGNSITSKSSVAIGYNNNSGEDNTISIGQSNNADLSDSTVIGYSNSATGSGGTKSVAIGHNNSVTGDTAVALGANNIITGSGKSTAVGIDNTVSNTESHAFGRNISISSPYSVEFGIWGSATARQAAVKATYDGGVALTCENSASAPSDQATAGAEDIQELGRGMFTIQRNGDAFTLYFNDGGTIKSLSLGSVS